MNNMKNDLGLKLRDISKKVREKTKSKLNLVIQEDSTSQKKNGSLHYRQKKQRSA